MDKRGRVGESDCTISRIEDLARQVHRASINERTDERPAVALTERGGPSYRNPENACETWSGRGRPPAWFDRAIHAGRSPEGMLG